MAPRDNLPLARSDHNRDATRRADESLLESLWSDGTTRVLVIHHNQSLVSGSDLVYLAPREDLGGERVYLGTHDGQAYVALALDEDVTAERAREAARVGHPDVDWLDLRVAATALSDRDTGLFTQALALAHWHASHPFAPRTGAPTRSVQSGWVRADDDGTQVFPRTDPAVIVLIRDRDDRILLGNNALWQDRRFSLLAGYVEPGESLEAAVIREVFEECGLRVTNPQYVGSQPWPFPASLMMGFTAEVAEGQRPEDAVADGEEIRELRWFSRAELKAAADEILFPGPVAIARHMIEDWLGETLPQEDTWLGRP